MCPTCTIKPNHATIILGGVTDGQEKPHIPLALLCAFHVHLHHEGDYYSWTCTDNAATHRYEVNIYSDRLGQVDYISAISLRYDGNAGAAGRFLGFIASVPYDGAQPGEARRWVEGHISAGEAQGATFGGVPFGLHGEQSKTLTIGAFKWQAEQKSTP